MIKPNTLGNTAARLLLALLAACGLSSASSVIVPTGVDWNRGESIWLKEDGTDTQAYFAGVIYISLTDSGHQYDRDTLCVDLFTDIYLGISYNTTVVQPQQVPGKNLTRVSWLVDNALLPTQNQSYTSLLPQADFVATAAQGAGIQLAVWDIVHDGGDGFSTGRVQASANTDPQVVFWAQTYEALSENQSSGLAFIYDNTTMDTGMAAQMLAGPMFQDGGPAPNPVAPDGDPTPNPEPSTLLLGGGAALALGWHRHVKK